MTNFPNGLRDLLRAALNADPTRVQYIGSGSINQAARVSASGQHYFIKWKNDAPPGFFAAEVRGLALLRAADEIRVPEVIAYGEAANGLPAYLILEWIPELGRVEPLTFAVNFGRALARLHRVSGPFYGLDHDNFIGQLPQSNRQAPTWAAFYRDQRLLPMIEMARARGRLPREREAMLRKVVERTESLLGGLDEAPSLLHGDLWSGNFLITAGNQPVLVDPAVYFGNREVELAFTELFGGFPPGFLAAYREAFPLEPGYERRRPLHQLYPLLVHLNLFGESYGPRVEAACRVYLT
jgi:fructosamine-3-kinase